MRISRTMLRSYVDLVSVGFFAATSEVPDEVEEYDDDIDDMLIDAAKAGDTAFLRLGLLQALHDEDEDIERYGGAEIPLHRADLRRLLERIIEKIEPIDPFAPEGPGVRVTLVDMTREEWRELKG